MVRNFVKNEEEIEIKKDTLNESYYLPGGMYQGKIKMIFWDQTSDGKEYLKASFGINGKELSQSFYVLHDSGNEVEFNEKKNQNQRTTDGENIHALIKIASNNQACLGSLETATKIAKVWSNEANAFIDGEVEAIPELIDVPVCMLIKHIKKNKKRRAEDGTFPNVLDNEGNPIIVEENKIYKFICPDTHRTFWEITQEIEEPTHLKEFLEKFQNQIVDKTSKVSTTPKTNTFKKSPTTTKSSVFKK